MKFVNVSLIVAKIIQTIIYSFPYRQLLSIQFHDNKEGQKTLYEMDSYIRIALTVVIINQFFSSLSKVSQSIFKMFIPFLCISSTLTAISLKAMGKPAMFSTSLCVWSVLDLMSSIQIQFHYGIQLINPLILYYAMRQLLDSSFDNIGKSVPFLLYSCSIDICAQLYDNLDKEKIKGVCGIGLNNSQMLFVILRLIMWVVLLAEGIKDGWMIIIAFSTFITTIISICFYINGHYKSLFAFEMVFGVFHIFLYLSFKALPAELPH